MVERRPLLRVIGFVYDAAPWCHVCLVAAGIDPAGDEVGALFDDTMYDYPVHCHVCHEFLGGELTADGFEKLKQAYRDGHFRLPDGSPNEQFEEYMREYEYGGYISHFIWTFIGLMDPYGNILD